MGRPTKYKENYPKLVYKLCLLGAIDKEICDILEITEETLNQWKKSKPEFSESIKKGKEIADSKVAKKLLERCMGYEHKDLYITQYQGKVVKEEIIKHYPPETLAIIFWLKNRQPDKWRDRQELDHTSQGESMRPIQINVTSQENAEKYNKIIKRIAQLN